MKRWAPAEKNELKIGACIALITPMTIAAIALGVLFLIPQMAQESGLSQSLYRTVLLVSICSNIYWINYYNRAYYGKALRAVITVTMILSLLWVFYFYNSFQTA